MREKSNKKKRPAKKEPSILKRAMTAVLVIAVIITGIFILQLRPENPVIISEDEISIYLHKFGPAYFWTLLTGGYGVRFDDIADIELLPYSARQLGDRIEDLRVPALREHRLGSSSPLVVLARYADGGKYRLHVSLFPDASPTIWITRYEGVPVLLSFRDGSRTEALYELLVTALEQWQAS